MKKIFIKYTINVYFNALARLITPPRNVINIFELEKEHYVLQNY